MSVQIEYTAVISDFAAKLAKMEQANQLLIDSNRRLAREAAKGSEAEVRMGAEARRAMEGLASPLDRHNRALQDLQRHYDAGRMSSAQFAQAKAAEIERYRQGTEATKQAAADQVRLDQLRKRSADDVARAERDQATAASRLLRGAETPKTQHLARLREIEELRQAGQLSDAQAKRLHLEEIRRYQQSTDAFRRMQGNKASAAAEEERIAARGKQLWEQTRTPLERYKTSMRELRDLFKRGAIDQDTFRRSVTDLQGSFLNAGNAAERSFGSTALQSLTNYMLGVVSIGTAIGTATQALSDMQAAREAAGQRARTSRLPLGALAQVSKTPEEFQDLVGKARAFHAAGGAASEEEAARVIFDVASAGQLDQLETLQKMRASGFVGDTGILVRAARTLETSMGTAETGKLKDIVTKAIIASGPSPASTEGILEAAARSGTGAKALRLSDEEILAAVSQTATATGSADVGGTQVASLMRSLEEIGAPQKTRDASGKPMRVDKRKAFDFKGKSLLEMLRDIESRKFNARELQELMGRHEALNAYRVLLQNQQDVAALTTEIQQGATTDVLAERIKFPRTDESVAAAGAADIEKAKGEQLQRDKGTWSNVADTMRDRELNRMREQGTSEWRIWFRQKQIGWERWLGGDEQWAVGDNGANRSGQVDQATLDRRAQAAAIKRGEADQTVEQTTELKQQTQILKQIQENTATANRRAPTARPAAAANLHTERGR